MIRVRFVLSIITFLSIITISSGASIKVSDFYKKKSTWSETMSCSLQELVSLQEKQEVDSGASSDDVGFVNHQEQKGIQLSAWQTLPPFEGVDLKKDYGPELDIKNQEWIEKPKWRAGYIVRMSMPGKSIQYCYCKLLAKSDQTVKAYFGSDDGIAVFLNGDRILLNDARRGVSANQEIVDLDLKEGVNHLLLKIFNSSGSSGMYFSLNEKSEGSVNSSAKGLSKQDQLFDKLWKQLEKDFSQNSEIVWEMATDREDGIWSRSLKSVSIETIAKRYASKTRDVDGLKTEAMNMVSSVTNDSSLQELRKIYYKSVRIAPDSSAPNNGLPAWLSEEENDGVLNGPLTKGGLQTRSLGDKRSLRMAVQDLIDTYGGRYPNGVAYLKRLDEIDNENSEAFKVLKREALLANPLLDFGKLLMVCSKSGNRFSANWQTRASCKGSFDNALVVMPSLRDSKVEIVYKPDGGKFVGDVDLHFDADKILFSSQVDEGVLTAMPETKKTERYCVFEIKIDPKTGKSKGNVRRVSPDMGNDVDSYDACYLPNGKIIFASTASYDGVPCVGGNSYVANLYRMDRHGKNVRRLTFDQDASWHPSLQSNGRVMYTRWEYTDSAHYFSRLLMTMNSDGTDQKAYYGSNSYWPNSIFFARQIPGFGNSSKFISSITGHHSHAKGGALCIFDVAKGRHEADGALQLLTGYGKKVEPLVIDNLCRVYDPKFYHPYPLSEKYFLASANGSVYLVDIFDNMLCIKERDGEGSYYEPIPLQKRKAPPIVPDRINLNSKTVTVLINNIYKGPGLKGVPVGSVKSLRVYRYEYGPRHRGGHYSMGMEAGWDAKQILGIVPVEEDGSANFKIPANTPVAFQPLDKDGKALQIMRSWTVGMPGEMLSCVGCHESQNMPPPLNRAKAMFREPSELKPFFGPARGFSFRREIQPILDRYCVGCHDGSKDLTADEVDKNGRYRVPDRIIGTGKNTGKKFAECGIPDLSNPDTAHRMLHPYVRRNGPEGDYHLLTALEFHIDTSELAQMLEKGHHNVKLDNDSLAKLYSWMDLNAPRHGTWIEAGANPDILERKMELRKLYAFDDFNPESIINMYVKKNDFIAPSPMESQPKSTIQKPVIKKYKSATQMLDLGDGVRMKLVKIPSGEFSMGCNSETPVEQPVSRVKVKEPFYMGEKEVTLAQYRQFDPDYLNGVYDMHYKDQVHRGYYMNHMTLPVIRVSWTKAVEFCEWLSKKTGKKVVLPTEAQWEWACRSGTETPLSYGDVNARFSKYANMADITVKLMAVKGVNPMPIKSPNSDYDFELQDPRSDDNALFLSEVGSYEPNPWGLYDMHGNAAEWTRSDYKPYPYKATDGRNRGDKKTKKVVRGGSWHDRPFRCTSSYRLGFSTWQRVYHTGLRVIVEE